jgi:predicted AAA+ superfamily ATPase
LLAIKARVDRHRQPGQFLLTGSANLLGLRSVQDSLAGRAETIELFGFSQGEFAGEKERFVDRVITEPLDVGWTSALTRHDYLERACAGGYPEAVARQGRRRAAWFDSYAHRIIERDASDISALQRLGDLDRLLRLVAARNATELNQADLAADASFPARTLPPYLDLLETLYLIWRVPAWSTNLSSRVADRPKTVLLDSGLSAHLMHVSPASLHPTRQPGPAGQVLEGFVLGELRRQCGWNDEPVRIFHYRDRTGPEVDIILEHADGRVAAIEVKATTSVGQNAFKWLAQLRDRLGNRFVQGVVLYTGSESLPFGDRLSAQPISVLWQSTTSN